jgi:hypothetical protein
MHFKNTSLSPFFTLQFPWPFVRQSKIMPYIMDYDFPHLLFYPFLRFTA